ncbi:hypothetical protein [Pseudorhodoferax sp. Leaf265]|uniref:hypothetical protein n=1 Tax=Pseudorhodoferax sp. Leaf265 TaxID=1736315 RepID=UPI0006F30485|nr:hypothetical protein [Pseudorhodoferax sp. Leaf265]KQP21342.1 hypothetical protein ASF45_03965 [Pseudorhodoferax sp. Leaf265]
MSCPTAFEIAKLLVSLVTVGSLIYAIKAYNANVRKQQEDRVRDADKELVTQARLSLEWAYDALTAEGAQIPPKADRLNWLTCARHLLRHAELAGQITSQTYRTVHAEHEEFWRHRFYLALDDIALRMGTYYLSGPGALSAENIEPRSAAVVVAFSAWPAGLKDLTDSVDVGKTLHGREGGAVRGVRHYLEALDTAKAQRRG